MAYSKKTKAKTRYLLFNRVVCGEWIVGSNKHVAPPIKPFCHPSSLYESMTSTFDDKNSHLEIPEIVVTTNDGQAYPAFLVEVART